MHHGEKKKLVAEAALQCIKPGMSLGVGTGSTVNCLIDRLPEIREKKAAWMNWPCVAGIWPLLVACM